ncbi:MAG: tetratricopeptide repeat protein [Candidatus Cryptobacteroides sp.]
MKRFLLIASALFCGFLSLSAQEDKKEVRKGNSLFKKDNYKDAEICYRKALVKDSTSFAATYDLASSLYMQKDYEGAANTLEKAASQAPESACADRYYFNRGNVDLQKQDYKAAVDDFKQSLLLNPGDIQAKESYIYAKKMLEQEQNQQNQDQQGQDNQEGQDQQDKDNQQNQEQQQNQDGQQPQEDRQSAQQPQSKISPQQAQQMIKAIQAKEKETKEKVEKAKAQQEASRQKEKNW